MALINFLKNILKKEESKELEEEKVTFSTLHTWVKDKQGELKKREDAVADTHNNKTLLLRKKIDEQLPILKNVDIETKKDDARTKLIVKNNLNNYITFVERLIKNITDLKYTTIEEYTRNLDEYFADFFKKTNVTYEKSNYLVGKELIAVKEELVKFYKWEQQTIEKNKNLIARGKILASIALKHATYNEFEENCKEITSTITNLNKKIKETQEKRKELEKKVEEIKNSKEHVEMEKREKEVEQTKIALKNTYVALKQLIDFKRLTNVFHSSRQEMTKIKSYKEDFEAALKDGEELLSLLQEAKLDNETIKEKIQQIKNKKEELKENIAILKKKPKMPIEIKQIENDLETLEKQKAQELAIKEKLTQSKKDVVLNIKEELLKMNVILQIK